MSFWKKEKSTYDYNRKNNIKPILKMVHVGGNWCRPAYICEDGNIYIMILKNHYMTKEEFLAEDLSGGFNENHINERLRLYDDLEKYYQELIK